MNKLHVYVATINFQRLDSLSDKVLAEAALENTPEILEELRANIGFEIEQVAVINKCNAITLVFSFFGEYEPSFLKGRVLSTWDQLAEVGLGGSYRLIKTYEDIHALKYLAESALGIHSVTVGDSQVLSQVTQALTVADAIQPGGYRVFPQIVSSIKKLALEAKSNTALYAGNTSLERVATGLLIENLGQDSRIAILGAGRTSSLVTKILATEAKSTPVSVVNRSRSPLDILSSKYTGIKTFELSDRKWLRHLTHLVIGMTNTPETVEYVGNIMAKLPAGVVVYDLSSPSITAQLTKDTAGHEVFAVDHFSMISQSQTKVRHSEIDKVKAIIQQALEEWERSIVRDVAKYTFGKVQRTMPIQLDVQALNILGIRASMNQAIRKYFDRQKFIEITSPYIVGVSSDPSRVDNGTTFMVDWPDGGKAFLRQSNQLYKQMIVASGMPKIFEIGPFWRAEESTTYRHLLESIGLDVEFANPRKLEDVYKVAYESILVADRAIAAAANKPSALILPPFSKVPVLTYRESIELLQSRGHNVKYGQDLGLVSEVQLGLIIKKEYGSDAVIIRDYPDTIKKFYTKKKPNGETETFDIIIDGWELVSGAMRNTDRDEIEKAMMLSGINVNDYSFYLSLVSGAVPHGGYCLGLDRMVAKTLDFELVSFATAFPRTAERLIP